MHEPNKRPDPSAAALAAGGPAGPGPRLMRRTAPLLVPVLTAAMFADVFFTREPIVVSHRKTDVVAYFACCREFGFGELRRGNLPLWNPYLFSGTPFVGGFQSAAFYPPNLIYLVLPLSTAINLDMALQVLLAGVFMYLWTRRRGLHPVACALSSVLLMFSGPYFLHVFGGHPTILAVMAWTPLVFLSIDGLFDEPSLGWWFVATCAVAMQIVGGYPQCLFFTAVAAGIYSALCMVRAKHRVKTALGLAGACAGAAALAAVQLLTGLEVAQESIRSTGLSYHFASMCSFPPENFITLVAPKFFGDVTRAAYWGRWYLWEMSAFVGVTGLVLAVYGGVRGGRRARRFAVIMAAALMLLALGANTPLFRMLYAWVPGFNKFRGQSKYMFNAWLFVALLAGIGCDALLRRPRVHWGLVAGPLAAGVLLIIAGLCLRGAAADPAGWWGRAMSAVRATKQTYIPAETYGDGAFVRQAGLFASRSVLIAGGTFLLLSMLMCACKLTGPRPYAAYAVVLLAAVEVFVFARSCRPTVNLASTRPAGLAAFLAKEPGDYRIMCTPNPNAAMWLRTSNIWGYDPVVLKRYAEFIAFTQGQPCDLATQYVRLSKPHTLYEMLRCRFAFLAQKRADRSTVRESSTAMPRVHLVERRRVIKERDAILGAMAEPTFDPRETVILESPPDPEPVVSEEKGRARVVDSSTDSLTVDAQVPSPAILLITDPYSTGWRARALPGSDQTRYALMPANYVLRAIPLSRGHHRIRIEYAPLGFRIGKWISITSLLAYLALVAWYWRCRRSTPRHDPAGGEERQRR